MPINLSSHSMPPRWRLPSAALAFTIVCLLGLYKETAAGMLAIWERSDTYAHGFIVPPIVLWLVWRQRQQLAALRPNPSGWAVLLMLGAAVMWLLGDLVAVNAATQLALTSMIVLAVPAILGWRVAQALMFPLAFLFFAVPIGDFMMPQLMEWTADFTVLALRATGIPVYREGQQFIIPSGSWSVVEACSGIRYLIASVTVGALFAYLNYRSFGRRAIFLLVSVLVPVLANWLRAYIIVLLGHYSGNTIATGVDHIIYGWVFFGIVIMIMFAIGARWSQEAAPAVMSDPIDSRATPFVLRGHHLAVLTALAFVVLLPLAVNWTIQQRQITALPQLAMPTSWAGGWQLDKTPPSDWQPAFQSPSTTSTLGATLNGQKLGVYVGYYRNQGYNHKLVSSENLLVRYDDRRWARVAEGSRSVDLAGQQITVRTAELREAGVGGNDATRLAVWQVYWVNGRFVASDMLAKIHGALSRLAGQGDDSAVVIFYAIANNQSSGHAALQAFASANGTAVEDTLRNARAH